jgi:hypothetical protein
MNAVILEKEQEQKILAKQTLWDDKAFKFDSAKFTDQMERKNTDFIQNLESEYF